MRYAGKDITHWFDESTKNPKTCIDMDTGEEVYYTPEGRFLDVPDLTNPNDTSAMSKHRRKRAKSKNKKKRKKNRTWWHAKKKYCIGTLTSKKRRIRLINMLTDHDDIVAVPP